MLSSKTFLPIFTAPLIWHSPIITKSSAVSNGGFSARSVPLHIFTTGSSVLATSRSDALALPTTVSGGQTQTITASATSFGTWAVPLHTFTTVYTAQAASHPDYLSLLAIDTQSRQMHTITASASTFGTWFVPLHTITTTDQFPAASHTLSESLSTTFAGSVGKSSATSSPNNQPPPPDLEEGRGPPNVRNLLLDAIMSALGRNTQLLGRTTAAHF